MPATMVLANEKADWPYVTPDSVNEYLTKHETSWQERMPEQGSRLFYTDEQWPDVEAALTSDEGLRPALRETFLAVADKLASGSPKRYYPPEDSTNGKSMRQNVEELWQRRVGDDIFLLCLAARLSDDPAYKKSLHDRVITGCEYPQWGLKPPNMDLASGHMARGIALAWDWHRDIFTEEEQAMIREVMRERVDALYRGLLGEVYWARSYAENHNHIAAAALGFAGLAFYGDIPEARQWLAAAGVAFGYVMEYSADDGSSAEGVPYWTYSLDFILQYIEATKTVTNSAECYDDPFMQQAAAFRIACATPGFQGILPWGDAPKVDFYGPHHLLAKLAAEYHDGEPQYVMEHLPFEPRGGNDAHALLLMWYDPAIKPVPPASLDYHVTTWDVVSSRSGWGDGDYLLTLKSGFNNRNHSHLDAGSLAFIFGDQWLMMTPGYGKGAGDQKFWHRGGPRWDFFSNASESHSTLIINGKNQSFDSKARGTIDNFTPTENYLWTTVDLSGVFPEVRGVDRRILHVRGDYILVMDEVKADESVQVDWLAQVPAAAKVDGPLMKLHSHSGDLNLSVLYPADGTFAPRKPSSPKVDNPDPTQRTYTVVQQGDHVQSVVLMQPTFSGQASTFLSCWLDQVDDNGWEATINSGDWIDDLYVYTAPTEIVVDGGSTLPEIELYASLVASRMVDGKITRLFATDVTSLQSDLISAESEKPVSFELSRGDGGWMLELATPFAGELSLAEGLTLFDKTATAQAADKPLTLPAGYYTIAKNKAAALKLTKQHELATAIRPMPPVLVAAPVDMTPAPADVSISWEAEDNIVQMNSASRVVPKVAASADNALRSFGYGGPAESVCWEIDVPETGLYELEVRYCTTDNPTLDLLVDGVAPTSQALGIPLQSTGGWSGKNDDWKEVVLTDKNGETLAIPLTKGRHWIELANPVPSLTLDAFTLRGIGSPSAP
ncbi:DUF4962 domain-containing protein [Ruficoccus sp. ZRK36]|uniref:DUF4962 domain-containing protein n=1 Tax=Ruficoccus sp. ZRK36 TaxID=2866311 RepID=UPI001C72DD63|nr:DUF4962 domain-containing protein [Ruficoccus sp. ZRK36]QYY35105.1 DUF4962 domain-containing protein [Ruficoccus sp. ZRK36]